MAYRWQWRPLYWRASDRLARWRRAWRYAVGTIDGDDASRLYYDAEHAAGCYALESITAEDVAERLLEDFNDGPELRYAAGYAAGRVASKWESTGDTASAAIDCAYDIASESCPLSRKPVEAEEVEG